MEQTKRKSFVAYEYKEVVAEHERAALLMDGYESFGWEIDDSLPTNGVLLTEKFVPSGTPKIAIRMKRDRKLVNKMELTRLQRNFEACVKEIDVLEKSKTSKGTMYALFIGLIGTAFMACSVFAVIAPKPHVISSILFAIPAFIGWILPCFIYKSTVQRETERIDILIEEKYDEIYGLCEKGNKLLFK